MMKKYCSGLFVLFISILIAGCSIKESEEYAVIAFVIRDVKKNNIEAEIGDIIKENDIITTGDNSSCDVKIGESILRIKSKSNVKITSLIKYYWLQYRFSVLYNILLLKFFQGNLT